MTKPKVWSYGDRFDAQIKELYEQGYTTEKTAAELGVCKDVVCKRKKVMGLVSKRGRQANPDCGSKPITEHNERIEYLWNLGFTLQEIADDPEIFICRSTVSLRLREMGYNCAARKTKPRRRIPYDEIREIEELLNHPNHYSYKEIAEIMGLPGANYVWWRVKHIPDRKKRSKGMVIKMVAERKKRMDESNSSPSQTLRVQPS
jgi:hypothetical protein